MALAPHQLPADSQRAVDAELPLVARTFDAGLLDEEPGTAPGDTVHQLYHLARFERATGVSPAEIDSVVEWGTGHGSLAGLMSRIRGGRLTYVRVTSPEDAPTHYRYLADALGSEHVKLVEGPGSGITREWVNVVPENLVDGLRLTCDLFIATSALAPGAEAVVAERRWFGARHLLLTVGDDAALADRATADGARVEPVGDHAPGRRYLLR